MNADNKQPSIFNAEISTCYLYKLRGIYEILFCSHCQEDKAGWKKAFEFLITEGDRPREKIFLDDKVVSANVVCRKAMVQKKRTHSLQKLESSSGLSCNLFFLV
jgi:hypothetical protein